MRPPPEVSGRAIDAERVRANKKGGAGARGGIIRSWPEERLCGCGRSRVYDRERVSVRHYVHY